MNLTVTRGQMAALKSHLEDMLQCAALKPEATGNALVKSIPRADRRLMDENLIALYLAISRTD
jgi:hypothetical protein